LLTYYFHSFILNYLIEGHRASDWPTTPIWTGKLKIISKGSIAIITLLDDKGNTFAVCPVTDDTAVERTLDSGRYFVLRIKNAQGHQAFIGIAFNERNDAFDFNVSLSEFKSECEREKQAATSAQILPTEPKYDLTLKEGEKIHINIQSSSNNSLKKKPIGNTLGGGGKGLLAPPPADKGSVYNPNPSATTTSIKSNNITNNNDIFAGFTSNTSSSSSSSSSSSTDAWGMTSTMSNDPWGNNNSPKTNNNNNSFSDPWSTNFSDVSSDPFSNSSGITSTVFNATNSNTTTQQKFDAFGFPI